MPQVSIGLSTRDDGIAAADSARVRLSPAMLRIMLIAAAAASASMAWFVTRNHSPNPDAELIRVLQFMTLAKGLMGAGALYLVSIRFRYPIVSRLAFGYVAGGAIMASGPGAMWTTAHIFLGSFLFYSGLGVMLIIGWIDGGARWRLGGRRA